MIIKEATQVGNKVIRTRSKDVSKPVSSATQVVHNLIDSMRHHELVGMAAPQIGVGKRIFVTEIRRTKLRNTMAEGLDPLRVFINPNIISTSKKTIEGWEGCGSVACAGLFGRVRRSDGIVVEAMDENGKKFRLEAKGLLARIIQHEIDHLNGILFVDKSDPKTFMSRKEYLKLQSER